MPNLNAANFSLSYATLKRSLGARLQDRWITVKDFGATGDGSTNDAPAIQAALDFAYGTRAAPHGNPGLPAGFHTGSLMYTNRPVFFPRGQYKISSMLRVNVGYGVNLIGAGSHQTRLFWSGAEQMPPVEEDDTTDSALMTFYMCWGSRMEGITFDASNTQKWAFRLYHWPPDYGSDDPGVGDDGSGGVYRDVVFTNGAAGGFLSAGAKMGSERTFYLCKFLNNATYGHRLLGQNALNHSFYGCHFEGNVYGMSATAAGSGTFEGCTFANNSYFDIAHQYVCRIEDCESTSTNFACTDGTLIGNRHISASPGIFLCRQDGAGPTIGADVGRAVLTGNKSTNGVLTASGSETRYILKANTFSNPAYLAEPISFGAYIREDNVQRSP